MHLPKVINGISWYRKLVKSKNAGQPRALLDDYSYEQLCRQFVVALSSEELGRLYSCFPSPESFHSYSQLWPLEQRNFFEVILGEVPQKPHFDIDLSVKLFNDNIREGSSTNELDRLANLTVDVVVRSCILVLKNSEVPIDYSSILLYSSHGIDKRSYHIVIDRWCCANNKEAYALYLNVRHTATKLSGNKSWLLDSLDSAVYSSKQQFRLLGSQKPNSGRIKIQTQPFVLTGGTVISHKEQNDLASFLSSLVTHVSGCTLLPTFVQTETVRPMATDLPPSVVERAIAMLAASANLTTSDPRFPYRLREVVGNTIVLNRVAPSFCRVCHRKHEGDNPYMVVFNGGVHWCCRRSSTPLFIGSLSNEERREVAEQTAPSITDFHFGAFTLARDKEIPEEKPIPLPTDVRSRVEAAVTLASKQRARRNNAEPVSLFKFMQ